MIRIVAINSEITPSVLEEVFSTFLSFSGCWILSFLPDIPIHAGLSQNKSCSKFYREIFLQGLLSMTDSVQMISIICFMCCNGIKAVLLYLTPAFARNTDSLRSSKLFKTRLLQQRRLRQGHASRIV